MGRPNRCRARRIPARAREEGASLTRRYEIVLTVDAARDLEDIYEYIERSDCTTKADHVLDRIEAAVESLATTPARGPFPAALLRLGIREYGQVFYNPYRVIYRVAGRMVYVYLIADGRRDMQALLARRMLRG